MGGGADTLDTVLRYESCRCGAEFLLWRQDGRGWNQTQQEAFRDAHSGCRGPRSGVDHEPAEVMCAHCGEVLDMDDDIAVVDRGVGENGTKLVTEPMHHRCAVESA